MVHEGWIKKSYVQWWLAENPTVKKWLTKVVTKPNTQYDYGYNLMRFCEGVDETPEHLIEIRLSEDKEELAAFRKKHDIPSQVKRPDKDGSYVILDLLKEFIRSGKLVDLSPHNLGAEIKVAKLSKTKRHGLYAAVRAFFQSEAVRAALPDETFKIEEGSRVRPSKDFSMMRREGVEQAKRIILATKEPYQTLYWSALYGAMGDDELSHLNEEWPEIREQLQSGKDPVQVTFNYRKENELPYYTFVPARVFRPYMAHTESPFVNARRKKKDGGVIGGNPVNEGNLIKRWREGRRRSRVGIAVGVHNLRDLWDTHAVKQGLRPSVAEFLMGHSLKTIDPNAYNQIYKDVEFTMEQWEMMRKFIDGESEEWRKDVDALKQRLDKNEYERREDLRQANQQFLIALQFSPKQIKRIREQHNGDLANITKDEKRKFAEQAKARLGLLKPTAKESKPPPRLRVTKEEAELLQEQGWEKVEVFESGRVLLEWRYATPPPKRSLLVPNK